MRGSINYLRFIFLIAVAALGTYYEAVSALVSVLLVSWLFIRNREKGLKLYINDTSVAIGLLWIFYGLTCIWAVDSGMAMWGVVRYLPLPLIGMVMMQLDEEEKKLLVIMVPYMDLVFSLLSVVLMYVPALKNFFVVNGRLAGIFGYPNSFAMFLLIGLFIVVGRLDENSRFLEYLIIVLLIFALVASGSRTVLAIGLVSGIIFLVYKLSKAKDRDDNRRVFTTAVGIFFSLAVGYGLTGVFLDGSTAHIVADTNGASTMWGRLLYYKDGLKIIFNNPMGLGYLGYYIRQGELQTGAYTVRWIHNGFLQILLDVGWIPGLLVFVAVVKSVFEKTIALRYRILFVTIIAHGLFDFDLEFICMYFVLFACMPWQKGKPIELSGKAAVNFKGKATVNGKGKAAVNGKGKVPVNFKGKVTMNGKGKVPVNGKGKVPVDGKAKVPVFAKGAVAFLALGLSIFSVYIGLVSTLTYVGKHELAYEICPINTFSEMELLCQEEDVATVANYAEDILNRNQYISLAWNGKALAAYSQGDFEAYMEYKKKAIACSKYSIEEYVDYFEKLSEGAELYRQCGDLESAQICQSEIAYISTMLDNVNSGTDPLARRMADESFLEMPEKYNEYVSKIYN